MIYIIMKSGKISPELASCDIYGPFEKYHEDDKYIYALKHRFIKKNVLRIIDNKNIVFDNWR